ncbi:MAG: hypothetical protein Q7S76_02965 [bacterium]|nr:hypothetical protein [bacterium]
MKSDPQENTSGFINFAFFLITIVAVIEIEREFNFPYSYSFIDWATAVAMGVGIYLLLSFVYSLIARRFKLPRQKTINPFVIARVLGL